MPSAFFMRCDSSGFILVFSLAVAVGKDVCTGNCPSQIEASLLLQFTSHNGVKPAETITADVQSLDVVLEIPTCDVAFADTESGADIQFEIDDQWTQAVQLVKKAHAGGVITETVRLSGWPSRLRLKARGSDAWCIDSITMSTGGFNVTILNKTEGHAPKTTDVTHWIDQSNGEPHKYVVPALPGNVGSETKEDDASATENATKVLSPVTSNCTTRFDERVQAMGYDTSEPGTRCVFGLDSRDEGEHCVFDNGVYGTLGWCYTDENRESWGACGESCPLWGQEKLLGKKLEKVLKTLNKGTASLNKKLDLSMQTATTTTSVPPQETMDKASGTNSTNTSNTTNATNKSKR